MSLNCDPNLRVCHIHITIHIATTTAQEMVMKHSVVGMEVQGNSDCSHPVEDGGVSWHSKEFEKFILFLSCRPNIRCFSRDCARAAINCDMDQNKIKINFAIIFHF